MGYASLFSYLTEEVGYANGSAQRRIDAARLVQEVPEAGASIKSGRLSLNKISLVQRGAREFRQNQNGISQTGIDVEITKKKQLIESLVNVPDIQAEKIVAQTFDLKIRDKTQIRTQKDDSVRIEMTLTKAQFQKLQRAKVAVALCSQWGLG